MQKILSGREAAPAQLQKVKDELFPQPGARPPCLVVMQVGNNPASASYIRQKKKMAEDFGILFVHQHLSATASEAEITAALEKACAQPTVDGLILQLPLDRAQATPADMVERLLEKIPPMKDADGLHSANLGKLFSGESGARKWTCPLPATALGVIRLLDHYGIKAEGKDVVIIGKSRLVGTPTAGLFLNEGATVQICHRRTQNLVEKTKHADIVVVAAGVKHLLKAEHLKKGAIVIDVGIHQKEDGKLTGDADPTCYSQTSAYSPVPGGVGPMTVAMLMENVLRLAKKNLG